MTREEAGSLQYLRAKIKRDIRELRAIERKEQSASQYGQSLLHSLKRRNPENNIAAAKAELINIIAENQRKYLAMRAELEDRISMIPDHYVRVVLSLIYVDGLTAQEAATVIRGNCTGGGITQLLIRYFKGS